MEINRKSLIESVHVSIDENLLKQQLNTDSNNKTTSEEFSRVAEMTMNIKEFYQKKGTYRLMDNG